MAKEFIPKIIGYSLNSNDNLFLGRNTIYDLDISVNINDFFGNHFAIFGSTGSGKSCALARIVQNLFMNNGPKNCKIIVFDANGEYHRPFAHLKNYGISFKAITTDVNSKNEVLKIPLWLLDTDDLALVLNASSSIQLSIIDKTLRFLNIFKSTDEISLKYKNSIIASSLQEIIMSGRNPVQIRDQVISTLFKYNTVNLNLESIISQPGYPRTIRQCFRIDESGKINAIEEVNKYLETFIVDDVELKLPDGTIMYTLLDLYDALNFALIDEGIWKSEDVYDLTNSLKVRLQNLIKNDYSNYFEIDKYCTKKEFIQNLFTMNNQSVQLLNCNINYIDDRFAKTITKIYSKLIFGYAKDLENRGSEPFNIILEEAHRYVQNDSDVSLIGYNIFERICKEGRKYGVLAGFISQRPSELSETCLSQISNYLIFKIIHTRDLEYIKTTVPYMDDEKTNGLKILLPGSCLGFGTCFNIPISIKFSMPNPSPYSESAKIKEIWYK